MSDGKACWCSEESGRRQDRALLVKCSPSSQCLRYSSIQKTGRKQLRRYLEVDMSVGSLAPSLRSMTNCLMVVAKVVAPELRSVVVIVVVSVGGKFQGLDEIGPIM